MTEITIEGNRNLGNYETIRLSFSANVEEGDDVKDVVAKLKKTLDWYLNEDKRQAEFEKMALELETADSQRAEKIRAWIEKFETLKAEVYGSST